MKATCLAVGAVVVAAAVAATAGLFDQTCDSLTI